MNLPLGNMAAGCAQEAQPEVHHAPAQSDGCEVRRYTQTVGHVVRTQTVRSDTLSGTTFSAGSTFSTGTNFSGTTFSVSTNGVTSESGVTTSYNVTTSRDVTVTTSGALLTSPLPRAGSLTQVGGLDLKCAGAAADIAMSAHDRPEGRQYTPEVEVEPEAEVGDGTGGSMDEDEGDQEGEHGEGGEPRLAGDRRLRQRSNRRPVHERFRQKRQTLQDMARPLKHWLYRHRTNPYPTREEKTQLARRSAMTLTQVSNWFANARRRLKNTVQDPGLSWGRRIKLYNSCVEGNAERLSVCSDDEDGPVGDHDDLDDIWGSDTDSGRLDDHHHEQESLHNHHHPDHPHENRLPSHHQESPPPASHLPSQTAHHFQPHQVQHDHEGHIVPVPPQDYDACANSDDGSFDGTSGQQQRKYKASILQRYLQDACDMQQPAGGGGGDRHRHPSGSLSSHDYEEWSSSSCSSPSHNVFEDQLDGLDILARQLQSQVPNDGDDMHFKEISAALALTTLKYRRMYVRP